MAAPEVVEDKRITPLITSRKLEFIPKSKTPKAAWLENLDTVEEKKLGMLDLHPDVFSQMPRIDVIHDNVQWQTLYKRVVCMVWCKTLIHCKNAAVILILSNYNIN